MLSAFLEATNEDGTYDIRITDQSYSGPKLWQIESIDGEARHIAWIDENTNEAISGIPDDPRVSDVLDDFAKRLATT